jgi:hypothetical protein
MQRPFLSRPGGQADAVGKAQPGHRDRVVHPRLRPQALRRRVLQPGDGVQRQVVGLLGVQAEQEGAGQRVGNEGHGRDCRRPIIGGHDPGRTQGPGGRAALAGGARRLVGVGTGSTVNHFIDALAACRDRIAGAVSSSDASTERLRAHGIRCSTRRRVERLPVYIDGADEIDPAAT